MCLTCILLKVAFTFVIRFRCFSICLITVAQCFSCQFSLWFFMLQALLFCSCINATWKMLINPAVVRNFSYLTFILNWEIFLVLETKSYSLTNDGGGIFFVKFSQRLCHFRECSNNCCMFFNNKFKWWSRHGLTLYVILNFSTHFISRTTNVNYRLENKSSNNVTSDADEAEIEAALSKMYDEIKLQSLLYSYSNYD